MLLQLASPQSPGQSKQASSCLVWISVAGTTATSANGDRDSSSLGCRDNQFYSDSGLQVRVLAGRGLSVWLLPGATVTSASVSRFLSPTGRTREPRSGVPPWSSG